MTPSVESVPQGAPIATPDRQVRYSKLVRCFCCEGAVCPKCGGSGFRERKRCARCRVPAGRPSQGGKALSTKRGAQSWVELTSLPLNCMDCNPRFLKAGLTFLEGRGG